jgi:hypothetical protein
MKAYRYNIHKCIWTEEDIIMPTLELSNLGFKDCWYYQVRDDRYVHPQKLYSFTEHIIFNERDFTIKDVIE